MSGLYFSISPDGKLIRVGAPERTKSSRDNKGNSLLEDLSSYCVIDLETTGLDPFCDDIIEIACIKIEHGMVVEQFQSLINPGYQIPEFITEFTGITDDMLKDAPRIGDVINGFLKLVGTSIIVGHNVNFDINFLYDNCNKLLECDFTNDFIDTMRISRRMFQSERHHRLSDLVERFGIAETIEHRALSDAIKTSQCYEYMKRYASENNISFQSLYPDKNKSSAKLIQATADDFDTESPIYDKVFVFTGTLERMKRSEAMQIVVNLGGKCGDGVTQKTNFLVLGNNDYCPSIKDGKSSKQKKAEQYKLSGLEIEIISENVFYDMIL